MEGCEETVNTRKKNFPHCKQMQRHWCHAEKLECKVKILSPSSQSEGPFILENANIVSATWCMVGWFRGGEEVGVRSNLDSGGSLRSLKVVIKLNYFTATAP